MAVAAVAAAPVAAEAAPMLMEGGAGAGSSMNIAEMGSKLQPPGGSGKDPSQGMPTGNIMNMVGQSLPTKAITAPIKAASALASGLLQAVQGLGNASTPPPSSSSSPSADNTPKPRPS